MPRLLYFLISAFLIFIGIFAYSRHETSADPPPRGTIIVKNGLGPGQDAEVPSRPKKAAFLNSSSLDLWVGAGGQDSVAAYVKFATAPAGLYDKLKNAAVLGHGLNVNPERIIAQQPDLVVGNGGSNAQALLGNALRQSGIALLAITNNSLADTFDELSLYGRMTGHPELAAQEIQRISSRINEIAQTHAGKKKPKVALIWGTPASFSLLVPNSRQGEFLRLAGGENIVRESDSTVRYIPISMEYIAGQDPDYLFFINMGDRRKMQQAIKKLFAAGSAWNILRAVKEDKIYVLPPELFTAHYGLSVDKSVEYMNKILHP